MKIYMPAGVLEIVSLGQFANLDKKFLPMRTVLFEEEKYVEAIQIGPFSNEPPLSFKKTVVSTAPIFDYALYGELFNSKDLIATATEHFAGDQLKKLFKKLPFHVTNEKLTINIVSDAYLEFTKENGYDGNLILIDQNTSVIANKNDFDFYLLDIHDRMRGTRVLHGAVVLTRPNRAVRIEHKEFINVKDFMPYGVQSKIVLVPFNVHNVHNVQGA